MINFTLPEYVYIDELNCELAEVLKHFGKMPESFENAVCEDFMDGELGLLIEDLDALNSKKVQNYINILQSIIRKYIPNITFTFKGFKEVDSAENWRLGTKRAIVATNDFETINKFCDDNLREIYPYRKATNKRNIIETVISYILEKEEISTNKINEDSYKGINEAEFYLIDYDNANDLFTFKPELTDIKEIGKYIQKDEKTFEWGEDAPGQQKLNLKYESISKLNEVLEEIIKGL